MKRTILLCVLLAACLGGDSLAAGNVRAKKPARTVSGIVYFTNNSPQDNSFFVELFAGRAKRRIAAKWTEGQSGSFEFKGLRPGIYYVQVSGTNICLLQYEVDTTRSQPDYLRVFGDAGCGHHHVAGLPAPRPLPHPKKR